MATRDPLLPRRLGPNARGNDDSSPSSLPIDMQTVLQRNFVAEYDVLLEHISCAVVVRPVNEFGLQKIEASVRSKGWLPQHAPIVVLSREVLPDGELTEDTLRKNAVRVLDGNHRVTVLKRMYGGDYRVRCMVYFDFPPKMAKIIADSFNDAAESVSDRTLYDRLYFFNELIDIVKKETGKRDVSAGQLAMTYKNAGTTPPSEATLRHWKKAVGHLSGEAFAAIKEVCEDTDKGVDRNALTLTHLQKKTFGDLKDQPLTQALLVHNVSRYKSANRIPLRSADLSDIVKQVTEGAALTRSVEAMVPRDLWTDKLSTDVALLTRGRMSVEEHRQWVGSHFTDVEIETKELYEKVPDNASVDPSAIEMVKSRLPRRLELIIGRDSSTRTYFAEWKTKYAAARDEFTRTAVQGPSRRHDFNEDSVNAKPNNSEGDGFAGRPLEGSREGELCKTCKPQAGVRYYCEYCGMKHHTFCKLLQHVDEDVEASLSAKRLCLECRPDGKRKPGDGDEGEGDGTGTQRKTRKKAAETSIPTPRPDGAEGDAIELSREINCTIHKGNPLLDRSDLVSAGTALPVVRSPTLAIVAIEAQKSLVKESSTANDSLGRVIRVLLQTLHPCGTVAFAVPRPWLYYGSHIRDHLVQDPTMAVEESPLLLEYSGPPGGRPTDAAVTHHRNNTEMILIAHKLPSEPEGKEYTINRRVTVQDVDGVSRGQLPMASQVFKDLSLPRGGPNGGPRVALPSKVLVYLVNRFTNLGDTVLGVGVETTAFPEVALEKGRQMEMFLADAACEEGVRNSVNDTFLKAYNSGLFRQTLGGEVFVGPNVLPASLPQDTTPSLVNQAIREGKTALDVCKSVTSDFGYELTYSENDQEHVLVRKTLQRGEARTGHPDIPLWGKLIVYDSPDDALDALSVEEREQQYVRLVKVCSTLQLNKMLSVGVEQCRPSAALYMRVAPSCPIYWVSWDSQVEQAAFDICSLVPQRGGRQALLDTVIPDSNGGLAPLVARIPKNKDHTTVGSSRPLYVNPGQFVVRGDNAPLATATVESADW